MKAYLTGVVPEDGAGVGWKIALGRLKNIDLCG